MNISIFGLGYVGTVCAGCMAQDGNRVIGVDLNPKKVDLINKGSSTIIEEKIEEIIRSSVKSKNLQATLDYEEAVAKTDLSLLCVGTPSRINGDLDVTYLKRVCVQIGRALARKHKTHSVVIRSTVIPGTTENILIPILERYSGKKCGPGFKVAYNPEFLREGISVQDYYNPPKIIIGQLKSRETRLINVYKNINASVYETSIKTAEMVKYADNTFHAVKVVFANEMGNICKKLGVDSHEMMGLFCKDTKLNLSPYYLKPGFAFGGSCLPKDIRAILYRSKISDLSVPLIESVLPSNELQIRTAIELIESAEKKKVGLLGLSFKAGTDDLRESPLVRLSEALIGKGYNLRIYDENVSLARIHGANKEYIEKEIPHISSLMCSDIADLLGHAEIFVVGSIVKEYWPLIKDALADKIVVDLVRWEDIRRAKALKYIGLCW